MPRHLFISDLHLDVRRPQHIHALQTFCSQQLQPNDHLYILGDLFEVWLGDDIGLVEHAHTVQLLYSLGINNTHVFIQTGNRDFLLGDAFFKATNSTALLDEHIISINNQPVLLMHGDSLCTDDVDYQTFRQQARSKVWQQQFLSLNAAKRIAKAQEYRQISQAETAKKDSAIMDVNQRAVAQVMQRHNVDILIHGHTHLPMVHSSHDFTRIVLGDWRGHFDYLCWEDDKDWHFLRQSI